jgi:putative ribosome biogenesis GTPase RsgA
VNIINIATLPVRAIKFGTTTAQNQDLAFKDDSCSAVVIHRWRSSKVCVVARQLIVTELFSNREEDIVIALMGMTGAGKSSLISLCTGKEVKIGHSLESCEHHALGLDSTLRW